MTHDIRFGSSPLMEALGDAENVLLTGAGGGCDVFSALPVALALHAQGRKVHLANYTFTYLDSTAAIPVGPLWTLSPDAPTAIGGMDDYQAERHLARWLRDNTDMEPLVWAMDRTGVIPAAENWTWLASHLGVDTIVAVDGGTDSLLTGSECGLGTPVEDATTLLALHRTPVPRKLLLSIGFGVDSFHGVAHSDVLESVAALDSLGAFWGVDHLSHRSAEGAAYIDMVRYANRHMAGRESIVASSVAAAVDSQFGNVPLSARTVDSELFINPLMAVYWTFDLDAVASRIEYTDAIAHTRSHPETLSAITAWRASMNPKPRRPLPM